MLELLSQKIHIYVPSSREVAYLTGGPRLKENFVLLCSPHFANLRGEYNSSLF